MSEESGTGEDPLLHGVFEGASRSTIGTTCAVASTAHRRVASPCANRASHCGWARVRLYRRRLNIARGALRPRDFRCFREVVSHGCSP